MCVCVEDDSMEVCVWVRVYGRWLNGSLCVGMGVWKVSQCKAVFKGVCVCVCGRWLNVRLYSRVCVCVCVYVRRYLIVRLCSRVYLVTYKAYVILNPTGEYRRR